MIKDNLIKWLLGLIFLVPHLMWIFINYFLMLKDIGNDEFVWPWRWEGWDTE